MSATPEFRYVAASSLAEAARELAIDGSHPLGGGTDLVVQLHEQLVHAERLVDLTRAAGAATIERDVDGGLRIGAGARIGEIAAHDLVRRDYPALAEACDAVGTPAIRNMGTLGGNLCQRPRCWYFRRGVPCRKHGGDTCPAEHGENQHHAIFGGGPCFIVHPSDPAVALAALDAEVAIESAAGSRRVPIAEFFVLPTERLDAETVLERGEFVSAIHLSADASGGVQRYEKLMQRGAWDFALASLAAVRRRDGTVRLVLGGVAPKPWRVTDSVEEDMSSGGVSDDDIETLAERALYDARPLEQNGYKVQLARTLLVRGMRALQE